MAQRVRATRRYVQTGVCDQIRKWDLSSTNLGHNEVTSRSCECSCGLKHCASFLGGRSVKFCAAGCDVWRLWGLFADAVFTFRTVAELHLCLHIKFFPTLSVIFATEVPPF